MKISREFILANRTPRGAWTRKQMAVIGVKWPPRAGWIYRVSGTSVSDEQAAEFVALGKAGRPRINPADWVDGEVRDVYRPDEVDLLSLDAEFKARFG